MNSLDLPMWKSCHHEERSAYATDVVAWDYARGHANCPRTTPYPTEHVRWGLAGAANTVTYLHIDSDGFCTDVQVMCGKKVWAIYRESSEVPLSSINTFIDPVNFKLDEIPEKSSFGLEAIVLRPGDRL